MAKTTRRGLELKRGFPDTTKVATGKIQAGVHRVERDVLKGRLELLIKTLRRATFGQRLRYLVTGQIPLTKAMQQAKDSKGAWTVDSYSDWLVSP